MTLLHFDANNNYIQSIPQFVGGRGGYTNCVSQSSTSGGYGNGGVDLPPWQHSVLQRMDGGHSVVKMEGGRQAYRARLIEDPNEQDGHLSLCGHVSHWASNRSFGDYTFTNKLTSDCIKEILSIMAADKYGFDMSDTSHIAAGAFSTTNFLRFSKTTVGEVIKKINEFEGYEWGGEIWAPGNSLTDRETLFFRAANMTALNYKVDLRDLVHEPVIQRDMSNFGTIINVYYGTGSPPATTQVTVSAEATARRGDIWHDIDISGSSTVLADATQAGTRFRNSLIVDGEETPPVSIEMVLGLGSHLRAVTGGMRNIMTIEPGANILLTGTRNYPRSLAGVDSRTFVHVNEVRRDYARMEVALRGNRIWDPAVMIARLANLKAA
ncbi:MAG: hypothetical protein M0Z43_11285 [Acidithiobacillus sp.]|nr:hypothetical protein [Acidithiobacillus sp.]